MPKIINAFRANGGGAGQMLQELGQAMFGDQVTGDLKRAQLYGAQRENTEMDNLMSSVQSGGTYDNLANPNTQAQIIGSGYDPSKVADLARAEASAKFGAQSDEAARAAVGAGGAYSSTGQAFGQTMAEQQRQFNMMPTEINNGQQNVYASREDALGMPTGVNATTARKPFNIIHPDGTVTLSTDGLTDLNGQPISKPGYIGTVDGGASEVIPKPVINNEASATVANQKLNSIMNMAESMTSDPTLFGPVGYARTLGQEIGQGMQGVASLFAEGGQGASELNEARQQIASAGLADLVPEMYDPNLSKVDAIWGILLYQGAAALAGQNGRSVSDKDIAMMRGIMGDPKGLFSSAESMKAKLGVVRQMLSAMDGVSRNALGGDMGQPIQNGPQVGTVEDGYQYIGPDPADPASWRPVR